MKKTMAMFLIILFCNIIAHSQVYEVRNKAIVTFHANVTMDSASLFIYSYVISNDKKSDGVFNTFRLFAVDPLLISPRTSISSPVNKKWYIGGWGEGCILGSAATRFFDIPPENGLAPGESMTISFKSSGLPSIETYYAQSFAPPQTTEEFDSLMSLGYTADQLMPDWQDNSYKNQTVAPNTNLLNLSAWVLLDTLISYKHQSVTLGWLTNGPQHEKDEDDDKSDEGIVERLDRRLDKAKAALAKSDSVKARLELELFVKEVEDVYHQNKEEGKRLGVPVLTSEGYALLKYNAEYLIDRLPERSRR